MNKPLIGIIGNLLIDQGGMFPGYERAYVNNDYVQTVAMAGGTPFILPLISDYETIKGQIANMDALIISGGYDVNPLVYGEEPISEQGFLCPERDDYDVKVVKIALELNKPILGICRGMQILNATQGGKLHQDISKIEGSYIKHQQSSRPDVASHTVEIVKETKLFDILGESVLTNSFHHQAIKEVATGFKVSARAKDGVIEAIEKEEGFVIGVQWHPEMMAKKDSRMLDLFKVLIKQCTKED
ncbi:MAG: gamma-glutamyl-gamma-aminobutyrate hydrolase family protein [Clostridiaceae bacterium]|nr:gamma-glutamyl-gamma-aminobutyrate hydrolase family protein [Clostridiaceae bacterium]